MQHNPTYGIMGLGLTRFAGVVCSGVGGGLTPSY
jgi:hypothetical protein